MRELTVYAWVTSAALPAVSVASTVNEPPTGVPVGIAAPSATSPSHVATATLVAARVVRDHRFRQVIGRTLGRGDHGDPRVPCCPLS